MRGKFITTTIMLAALSGGNNKKINNVDETVAATESHKIIWSKDLQTKTIVLTKVTEALSF